MVQESAVITKSNIFTQVISNIFNVINDRSNVPDPADSSGNRKFVYTREPNYEGRNFHGFPVITIPSPEYVQGEKVASATRAFATDLIQIIVVTQDKSADGTGDPNGRAQLEEISNNIAKTLNDLTVSATLRNYGLKNKEFTSVDVEWPELNGKPTFRREFNIRFRQLRVIA